MGMSMEMMRDGRYGRGDPRVYRDKDHSPRRRDEYDKENEREMASVREQHDYSPRHHHDGGGGGGDGKEYERMRAVDRKYWPGQGGGGGEFERARILGPIEDKCVGVGISDGDYLREPRQRLMRDYNRHGEFERERMQGPMEEEERRVGGYLHVPVEVLRRDYNKNSDIVDEKYPSGCGGCEFERPRVWGRGENDERRLGDGGYVHEPTERLRRNYNRHSDIVDGKYSPGNGGAEFERPRPWGAGKEEKTRVGVVGGGYLYKLTEGLRREYNRHSAIVDGKCSPGCGSGKFERPRMRDPGEEEERRVRVRVRVRDGSYLRKPMEGLRKDYSRNFDIVDGKYLSGCGGGEFMTRGPGEEVGHVGFSDSGYLCDPLEVLRRDYNRNSDIVDGKYGPGRGGGELERPRMRGPGIEEERLGEVDVGLGVSDGDYLHELPQERLQGDYNRHSDIVDRGREYDGGLPSFRRPDRDRSGNCTDEECSQRFYQSNKDLSRVDSTALKFQGNHLLDDHGKSDGMKVLRDVGGGGGGGGTAVYSERHYLTGQYLDACQSQLLLASNPLLFEAGKGRVYSSSYPLDVSVPPKSYRISDGGGYGLSSPYPGTSLHKGQGNNLHRESYLDQVAGDRPLAREVCAEDNPLRYSKDECHVGSSARPKAFATVSSVCFKDEVTAIRQGHHVHSDGVGLSSVMLNNPLGYDGYGEKLLTKSPVDPAGPSSDIRTYAQSYLVPTEEQRRSYAYLDVERIEGDYIVAGSQDIRGSIVGVAEEYAFHHLLRTRGMDPIVDRIDQISHGDHLRDSSRPWDHDSYAQGQSTPMYADGVGSSHGRTHEVDVLGYADTRLVYEREVFKDYGSDQPEEPHGYGIGCGPWSHHERPGMLTSGGYYDSPSNRLSPGDSSLPEPSRMILKHKYSPGMKLNKNNSELSISSSERSVLKIYDEGYVDELYAGDELDLVIVSGNSNFSSLKQGMAGRINRDVTSRITSRNLSQTMSSVSSKSRKSTRDIKARLGPRIQNVHVPHPKIKNHRSSVKSRLGPCPPNVHNMHPKTKKYRSSVKNPLGPGP